MYEYLRRGSLKLQEYTEILHKEGIGRTCVTFDTSAGETCPFASICKGHIEIQDGKRVLVQEGTVKCYALASEVQYPETYEMRKRHTEWLLGMGRDFEEFIDVIVAELNRHPVYTHVRIHSSGDFYRWEYYNAWRIIAEQFPYRIFFGYSKGAHIVRHSLEHGSGNFALVYSHGGLMDKYAAKHDLPTCYIRTKDNADWLAQRRIPVVCGEDDKGGDMLRILKGQSFAIDEH